MKLLSTLILICSVNSIAQTKTIETDRGTVTYQIVGDFAVTEGDIIIGNAAEHATAIFMAMENKMDLALGIAIGSSAQIALLVAPLLVLYSWAIHKPMSLLFMPLEIAGITVAVLIVEMISSDGETTWFEGVQLLAVYLILAVAFYFMPNAG